MSRDIRYRSELRDLRVQVTQADLVESAALLQVREALVKKGKPAADRITMGPIAVALRKLGVEKPAIGTYSIVGANIVNGEMPPEIQVWEDRQDRGEPVEPVEFQLSVFFLIPVDD